MLLSAVSVLVVAQSSSEIPEGLMNNPVYIYNLPSTLQDRVINVTLRISSDVPFGVRVI